MSEYALEITGVSKTFDRPAVNGLDLKVRAGEFYALLGPNGAGKTTLLRMVAGLLQPDAGSISVFGIDALKNREPLTGNGDAWLNLIHVDDAARAVLACEAFGESGQTYLICDDRPIRRREYFAKLASLVDAPVPVFEEQTSGSTDAAALNKRCSNRKLHDALRMSLKYPDIDAGLPHAVGNTA